MTTPVEDRQPDEKRLSIRQVLMDWLPVAALIVKWVVENVL
ncbi:hypothetical protein ACFYWY_27600 [Streptomyces sp. NPDC002870]